jgi:hypothetical protein
MENQEEQKPQERTAEELHQSHNKLFVAAFKHKPTIIEYLTTFFPRHLTEKMNLENLELDNTNYITRKMTEFFSDVVYRTTWAIPPNKKNPDVPRELVVTLLFEHKKGHPRYAIQLQFLQYMVEIWTQDIIHQRPLTIVIPILIHQGKRKFVKRPFYHYFKDLPEELRGFIPDFDFFLTSSEAVDDEKLFAMDDGSMLRSLFLTYKHIEDSQYVEDRFEEFFKFYEKNPDLEKLFAVFCEYFLENSELSRELLQEKIKELRSSYLKENVMSTYQNILQAGKLEGKLESKRLMVLRGKWNAIPAAILADQSDMPLQTVKDLLKGYDSVYAFWQKNKGLSTAYLDTKYLTDAEVKYLLDLFNK